MDTIITRTPGSQRIYVPVKHGLSLDDLRTAFIAFHLFAPTITWGQKRLPPTRTLLFRVERILWLQGCEALERQDAEPDLAAYAEACAKKVWNSRLLKTSAF
jgi:hypothetical protein